MRVCHIDCWYFVRPFHVKYEQKFAKTLNVDRVDHTIKKSAWRDNQISSEIKAN